MEMLCYLYFLFFNSASFLYLHFKTKSCTGFREPESGGMCCSDLRCRQQIIFVPQCKYLYMCLNTFYNILFPIVKWLNCSSVLDEVHILFGLLHAADIAYPAKVFIFYLAECLSVKHSASSLVGNSKLKRQERPRVRW